jgi:hypothetical protein
MTADVRWRNPDWYAELHRRARNYYIARLQRSNSQEQQRILFDYVFLHRDNPVVRPYFEWQESGRVFADLMCPGDEAELQAMVARHEGDESARIAAHWLARQPQGVRVFRQTRQQSSGFMAMVALHQASPEDREVDPSAQAAWRFLQQHAPLRTGEGATLFRFWMDDNLYQAVSPTQSRVFITAVQHYLTTPGLAYTLFPCADPEFWAAVFAYADLTRIPEADFEVGGRRYGMYGHDWRATPPMTWLALLADRETGVSSMVAPPPPSEQLIVLSHDDFASAVHGALRDFNRVDALRANPLTRSRLVADRVGLNADHAKRVAALQSIVKDAAQLLQSSPRDSKLYRALQTTYFQPAATQEQAAEWLDLPFSTYRRHLKAGITRILDMLWQQEIGGKEL